MKRMTKREFLKEYRTLIDDCVGRAYGGNSVPTNDEERWDWVQNDESLYLLAKRQGVRV